MENRKRDPENRNRLGEFLRARRARLSPEDVGFPRGGVRQVPGLRREEVAELAGLSTDYLARLEQGRETHPSASVLFALARTLRLEPEAQRYLFAVTDGHPSPVAIDTATGTSSTGTSSTGVSSRPIGENLLSLLDEWVHHPAIVLDISHDVVAANHLGRALFAGHRYSGNLMRLVFLDEEARPFFREREKVAASGAAALRAAAIRAPDDAGLTALIDELISGSEEFARLWTKAEVRDKKSEHFRVRHPIVGDLDLIFETFRPNGDSDHLVKVYRPEPGTATKEALAVLGSLTAEEAERPEEAAEEETAETSRARR
ncbi:helix-turn-helix domain-containing protein [Streptomyces sp. NPDC059743]|uniref:helix-turn-helix domain-containing protein n=1 Tax=Streptomyces sp. NPDC059743 TaxID=3346928 RepID=UPI003665DED5